MTNEIYKLFTDGGARGNPGPAGAGAVLFNEQGELVWFDAKYLGHSTNNKAEYEAILMGIKGFIKLMQNISPSLICYLDSELIVKQMNKEYKIKDKNLKKIYQQIKSLTEEIDIKFIHIYREKNKFADKLVNIILDTVNEKSEN